MANYGVGMSLASYGADVQRQGALEIGNAANAETRRNIQNEQNAQMEKQGKIQLGATLGATGGMAVGGPVGALIGGALGALSAGVFSR